MIDDAVADAHDRLEHQPKAAALEGVADARAPQCRGALVFEFGIVGMKNVYQIAATLARHIRGATRLGKQQMVFDGAGQAGDDDRHAHPGIAESLAERADSKPTLPG